MHIVSLLLVASGVALIGSSVWALQQPAENMIIRYVLRSYDHSMWHCRDGVDRLIPEGAPSYKDKPAMLDYINGMSVPDTEKPAFRTLLDGSTEPDVLDDGNCWVSIQSPSTGNIHVFLVSSDGFHDVPGNTYVKAVEDVNGKNYVTKMTYTTKPLTFAQLKNIAADVTRGKRIDAIIDEKTNYMYKGSDFAVDFLLQIVEDDVVKTLKQSANNWPVSLQLLDNYYFEKHGTSAFLRNEIDRGSVPDRMELSAMSVDSLDVSPFKPEPEEMIIYAILRSYDATMWHCRDGLARVIPKDAPSYKDKQAMLDYINAMNCPDGEKPDFRKLVDGSTEPDVLDDGNCWVSIMSPISQQRYSFLVTSDGFHAMPGGNYIKSIEGVNGKNYIKKMEYKTIPTTFPDLKRIGAQVARGKKIDIVVDENTGYLYKGPDFLIEFMLKIVDDSTRQMLMQTANNWPVSIQLLDNYHNVKQANSAFKRFNIPIGTVPDRAELSTMSVDSLDVSPNVQ